MSIFGDDRVAELIELIGKDATIALVDNFGGMRLYLSAQMRPNNKVVRAIGLEAAQALAGRFSPDVIRVPVARELRALHYRSQVMSYGKIAHRLGIVEPSVDRMFQRIKRRN